MPIRAPYIVRRPSSQWEALSGTISLRLAVDAESRELVIEVAAAAPGFAEAARLSSDGRGRPSGRWWLSHYKGRLAWAVRRHEATQTLDKVILPV
ncbi:hypothetical protein AB0D34_07955 [Streptomyces sp. NPDC048420]|uniref:hypothetical protein n=1 Tax=Streptomyces sp. NPDC048420 TaxID=3155755 RepID=UPI003442EB41